MKSPVILRIFKNGQLTGVKQFEELQQIIIGHNAEVQLDLDDPSVSSIHCLIEKRDSGFYISDLGSSTGTKKDGAVILDSPLNSGDNIEIGPFRIQFFVGAPIAPQVKAAPIPAPVEPEPARAPAPPKVEPAPRIPVEKIPQAPVQTSVQAVEKASKKTFSPASETKDLKTSLSKTRGPKVEVVVSWKERILETYYCDGEKPYSIGSSPEADVQLPSSILSGIHPFLEIKNGCKVFVNSDMVASVGNQSEMSLDEMLKTGKAVRAGTGTIVRLDQGDVLCLSLRAGLVQVYVRYVAQAVKPLPAPIFDFSTGELTSLIASFVIVSLMALYFSATANPVQDEGLAEDVPKVATFVYNTTTTITLPPVEPPQREVQVPTTTTLRRVMVTDKKVEKPTQRMGGQPTGQAAAVRANPNSQSKSKTGSVVKQGGSVVTSKTEGAGAQSKDPNKTGLLAAFSGRGVRSKLDEAQSGAGDLLGMSNQATGRGGLTQNRAGDDIGSRFKEVGPGGKGTATQGIAGIGTKGRASGMGTQGAGFGLGGKGGISVAPGGDGEEWVGSIDREEVRRRIRSIINQIKNCYERRLTVKPDLAGRVVIQFEIGEQGRIRKSVTKSSTLGDREVEACVASRIKDTAMPEPPAGVIAVVDYPFLFDKQQ